MPQPPKNTKEFNALVEIVKSLRGPDGCPWDKEQTHSTLTQYAIEEAHELAEAIEIGDQQDLVEELGDLLLQVVLHAEIARQENRFDISSVIESINQKMIRRHPHVFSDTQVKGSEEVLVNWAKIKAEEKKGRRQPIGFGVPVSMPALQRAQKIGEKTRKLNFDWKKPEDVVAKVEEEFNELKDAMKNGNFSEQQHEVGDLLFSVAQLARHLKIEPEQALRLTNHRFEKRFETMKEIAQSERLTFSELNDEELESLWQKAKKKLKSSHGEA